MDEEPNEVEEDDEDGVDTKPSTPEKVKKPKVHISKTATSDADTNTPKVFNIATPSGGSEKKSEGKS